MNSGRDGLHTARIREANERGVIAAIRQGGVMTKSELAGELGLTRQAVNIIVGEMLADGFLREGGRKTGGVGRSSAYYALDPAAAFSVGMVIEPGRFELMLVDFMGAAHYRASLAGGFAEAGPPVAALEGAAAAMRAHCLAAGIPVGRIAGICAVLPDSCFAHPAADAAPSGLAPAVLRARLEQVFGLPAHVERRAVSSAAAEHIKAEGALPASFAFLCCDRGVGAALMLSGELHRGEHGRAMHLGLLPVRSAEGVCALETVASLASLDARLGQAGLGVADIHAAALARPDIVEQWIADAGGALAGAFAFLQMAVDLGAGVVDIGLPGSLGNRLIERIAAELARSLPPGIVAPQILRSRLGRDAAVLGAAMLPLHVRFSPSAPPRQRRTSPPAKLRGEA